MIKLKYKRTGGNITYIEIYEYVEAYRKLIFSTDGKVVYNPTGITVYSQDGERFFCVKSGEAINM